MLTVVLGVNFNSAATFVVLPNFVMKDMVLSFKVKFHSNIFHHIKDTDCISYRLDHNTHQYIRSCT